MPTSFERRTLLKSLAAAGAASALSGGLPRLAHALSSDGIAVPNAG